MTSKDFHKLISEISKADSMIPVDGSGMPEVARELPMFELRELLVAMAKGYNTNVRKVKMLRKTVDAYFKKEE